MPNLNQCAFMGHLGRDPELTSTPGGTLMCKFSIAVSDSWKKGDEWQEKTIWLNVVQFGQAAERTQERLRKGDAVYVSSKLTQDEYTAKDGNRKTSTGLTADKVLSLTKRDKQDAYAGDGARAQLEAASVGASMVMDDDVPF